MANPISSMQKALAARLRTITGLTVTEGWPGANKALAMPALTILTGKPDFMNLQPYELSRTTPVSNQTTVARVVGQYDVRFQLDLWCRDRKERDDLFDKLFAKLNPEISPMGLNLQLTDYHNLWASFSTLGQEPLDDEAAAQRREWRLKLDLMGNCKAVLVKTEYAIITIENNLSTPDNI